MQPCLLVFDSTHSGEDGLADWYVNFDPSNTDICAPDGTRCRTRSGFKRAYDTSYRQVLDQQVRDCYSDGANKVVVVGHSQGGGIAPVGAVALADTDPTLVLFGAPGSINDDCPPLSREKYHRWLNTYVGSDGKVSHDPVANLNWRSEQYGHMYLMGNDPTILFITVMVSIQSTQSLLLKPINSFCTQTNLPPLKRLEMLAYPLVWMDGL